MYIIKTVHDVKRFQEEKVVSEALAAHLLRKIQALHQALGSEAAIDAFCLQEYGMIGVFAAEDAGLQEMGLPAALDPIMPEWVSRLVLEKEEYFVLYIMADNDCIQQIYFPAKTIDKAVRKWLSSQPLEEEEDGQWGDEGPF
ncbi:hypothetical protein [uncultured Anaeromusa sp.]|uniref:hypothetical protein n=1 Tax=uncultured Anaeromusa sp. TaxID=673273 RepID=UPI0029C847DD|nr:hypothetical protein [uncultured Anaeromusa sp.]